MKVKSRVLIVASLVMSGCYVGYWTYSSHGGGKDATIGEEREVNFQVKDALQLVESVLRADGQLFQIEPENEVVTFWRPADNPPDLLSGIVGVRPRYRYHIQVVPEGANKSKIVANVETEDIPDDQIARYKAGTRFEMFRKVDELANEIPPGPSTPTSGGVNYAILPKEDLPALAKRVTGDSSNWKQIAEDNGISSPSDVSAFQTVWVRATLLKNKQSMK